MLTYPHFQERILLMHSTRQTLRLGRIGITLCSCSDTLACCHATPKVLH